MMNVSPEVSRNGRYCLFHYELIGENRVRFLIDPALQLYIPPELPNERKVDLVRHFLASRLQIASTSFGFALWHPEQALDAETKCRAFRRSMQGGTVG